MSDDSKIQGAWLLVEVWDLITVWAHLTHCSFYKRNSFFLLCIYYTLSLWCVDSISVDICRLFSFHMFLCQKKNQEMWISLDPRWSPLGRFGNANAKIASDFQVWESAKIVKGSPSMVLISLAFWNLRLHYPNLIFWRSYGHIVIHSVIPIPSFPSMFYFPLRLLEVTQSADTEAFL